jgi:plastocyanin
VTKGIPVKLFITSTSKKLLCLMSDSLSLQREVQSQKISEIEFTPTASGKHRLYCPINGMEGTLLVKEVGMFGR